jgi:pimeloyl-ACP methyl ester carboxylesterase
MLLEGMKRSAKARYDGIVAFSQPDFTEDLKKIGVPVLVMHGDDDQMCRIAELLRCRHVHCASVSRLPDLLLTL